MTVQGGAGGRVMVTKAVAARAAGVLAVGLAIAAGTAGAAVPVIPGAVGFGIETPAGRGGRILRVTNLNDSGAGSLRAALEASGPRIVVFDVSGTITLSSQIVITNPFVTIAGQTAPSPGITVRGNYVGPRAHNILMQHLRVRTGYGPSVDSNTGAIQLYNPGSNPVYNVVIDHCSASWAINENLTTWGTSGDRVHDVTFRYTISSEGLACTPISDEGCHSKGLLIGDGNRNIAVLGTIFAHNADRLPELKGGAQAVLANNIMYNWDPSQQATHLGWESYFAEPTLLTVLGNAYIQGPNMDARTAYAIEASDKIPAGSKVYYNDNRLDFGTKFTGRIDLFRNQAPYNPVVTTPPISVPGLAPLPSSQVEAHLLAQAGARPCDRDPVDARIIDSVRNRTGKIINDQSEVGGWPTLAENRRPAGWDTDGDGMPDSWETGKGFNPASAADGNQDADGDGYTNIEEYLHDAAAEVECSGPPLPPPPPPAAPSNLAAGALSSSQVRLTWTDRSDNETGFRVERCAGSGCTAYAPVGTTSAGVTTYDDSGLQASTTYGYRVAATNGGGTSGYSNEASATTAAPPPPGAILFQDDFEDGVADGWTESGGSWTVITDGTKVYRQSGTSGDGLSAAGDVGWSDYTVEVRAKPVVFNSAGGFVRLMARYRDASNYYYLVLRSTQALELKKMAGGTASTLATKSFAVAADGWYTLRLEVVGTSLKGYVNGTLQLSATDSVLGTGRIGVGTYNAEARFDDMAVRNPGGTAPPGDADLDGVQDGVDNCPTVANAAQKDFESDGWGDMCDNCPTVANSTQQDSDSDGLGNACEDMRVNANVDDLRSSEARIDGSDYFDLARAFGSERGQTAFDPMVDLNRDRKVDGRDLALLTTVWGEVVP